MTHPLKDKLTYDYIVIGTGPAGAIIAKKLSDRKENSVLILEAGENQDSDQAISDSSFAPILEEQYGPRYFWQGMGIPQKGMDDRTFEWITGRLFGGGSSINGEQYVRPSTALLSEWEKQLGSLWSPQEAINHFKKIEKYNGTTLNPSARGYTGPIDIRQAPVNPTPMNLKLVSAIEQATGLKEILDYNDPATPLGPFTRWQLYQDPNGKRESSSTAFFPQDVVTPEGHGVKGRKLDVFFKSTAVKILIHNNRAIGVEFLRKGVTHQALARKKVILSAGINSAQLLLLSGIGPADQLKKAGIPVHVDNPHVGKGLHNHTLNFAVFSTNPLHLPEPLDANDLYTSGAFLPDPTPGADPNRRGVQLLGISANGFLTLAIIYLRPKSRGSIQIQSNDPLKIVLADEGFLADSADLEAIKNIFRVYVRSIAEKLAAIDPAYQLISPTLETINDDGKLEEFIRENFAHNHHHQGALAMAHRPEEGAVDPQGQVFCVKNLIAADASLIPFTVDGNTSAAAYLIGYTIAQKLLQGL